MDGFQGRCAFIKTPWSPSVYLLSSCHGRCPKEQKAESQQYLTALEEKALETFLKLMSDFGNPVKAKVMSFEDIEVARATRAAKEVIKGKGKRGRKRKSAAQEADEPVPEPEVARIIEAPEPCIAPVARMI
ncbi:hypothetical protein DL98DRAFT_542365 [Cadophora sp. DSE1049]|nr:hypothetical protein DL98DRAFT_542365 [Cadophora sp. DSE1049]